MEDIADEKYIALICNGEFNSIPGFIIGELFELFFDNINYNVVKQFDRIFVDFTGETICNDKDSKILIRFEVDGEKEEFAILLVKVDNEILNEEDTMDLLDNIAFVAETVWEEENATYEETNSDDIEEIDFDDSIYDDNINDTEIYGIDYDDSSTDDDNNTDNYNN